MQALSLKSKSDGLNPLCMSKKLDVEEGVSADKSFIVNIVENTWKAF